MQALQSRPNTPAKASIRRFNRTHSRTPSASAAPSAPGTPVAGASASAPSDPLHPTSIATLQQFHDHFAALSLSAEHEQDSLCREHLAEISGLREKCDGLIQLLKDGETEVGDMLNALGYVEERSESLRGACEDLLEEQVSLLGATS